MREGTMRPSQTISLLVLALSLSGFSPSKPLVEKGNEWFPEYYQDGKDVSTHDVTDYFQKDQDTKSFMKQREIYAKTAPFMIGFGVGIFAYGIQDELGVVPLAGLGLLGVGAYMWHESADILSRAVQKFNRRFKRVSVVAGSEWGLAYSLD